jgi:hypothetical protein
LARFGGGTKQEKMNVRVKPRVFFPAPRRIFAKSPQDLWRSRSGAMILRWHPFRSDSWTIPIAQLEFLVCPTMRNWGWW